MCLGNRELFVRNYFTPLKQALGDIVILNMSSDLKVMERLKEFEYMEATCYDPSRDRSGDMILVFGYYRLAGSVW